MTTSEILLRAADRVQFQGWTQEVLAHTADGNSYIEPWDPAATAWCAGGAIFAEVGNWTEAWPAINALVAQLNLSLGHGGDIVTFNNAPERTASEVADVMRRAAKTLDNETTV